MRQRGTGDYVGSVIGNVIALVLVNLVLYLRPWTRGVVLESWADILWAAGLAFSLQIAGNLVLIFYRPRWLDEGMQVLFSAAGLLSTIVFYVVFPLDFSAVGVSWVNQAVRVALMVGMGVTVIVGIVHLVRLLTAGLARA